MTEQLNAEKRILDAALKEFIQVGLSGARMQSIALRAGVNKALLHYYFRSKQNLYEAVLGMALGTVIDAFKSSFETISPDSDIRTLVRTIVATYVKVLSSNPDFAPVLMREIAEGGNNLTPAFESRLATFSRFHPQILGKLQSAIRDGKIRNIPPIHIFMNIMGMSAAPFLLRPLIQIFHRAALGTDIVFDQDFFDARVAAITAMVCDGLLIKE